MVIEDERRKRERERVVAGKIKNRRKKYSRIAKIGLSNSE